MTFEAAIREFLESFRLPGEAQKIIRILEHWSRQFYAQEPGIFASADAVYILAISVIMLNTDKHNPAVRPLVHASVTAKVWVSPHALLRPFSHHCGGSEPLWASGEGIMRTPASCTTAGWMPVGVTISTRRGSRQGI